MENLIAPVVMRALRQRGRAFIALRLGGRVMTVPISKQYARQAVGLVPVGATIRAYIRATEGEHPETEVYIVDDSHGR